MSGSFPFVYQPLSARDGESEINQFANPNNGQIQTIQHQQQTQTQTQQIQQPQMMMQVPAQPMVGISQSSGYGPGYGYGYVGSTSNSVVQVQGQSQSQNPGVGVGVQMSPQQFPYPVYPMQMAPGQLPPMPSFPPGTILYMHPNGNGNTSQSFSQSPVVLAKPPELDPSAPNTNPNPNGVWPTFIAMQTIQPPTHAHAPGSGSGLSLSSHSQSHAQPHEKEGQRNVIEGESLVNSSSSSDSSRWSEGSSVSAEVFKKRKRILWIVMTIISIICFCFTLVAIVPPSSTSVFQCSPHVLFIPSYSHQLSFSFGYFQYCSNVNIYDYNYQKSFCYSYPDHTQYSPALPHLTITNQGPTKIAQAFAILSIITIIPLYLVIFLQPRVSKPRVLHLSMIFFSLLNFVCQIVSVAMMVKAGSDQSSYNQQYLTGCSPKLKYGSILQIIVAVFDFLMCILGVLITMNRISFFGIFQKTEPERILSA